MKIKSKNREKERGNLAAVPKIQGSDMPSKRPTKLSLYAINNLLEILIITKKHFPLDDRGLQNALICGAILPLIPCSLPKILLLS